MSRLERTLEAGLAYASFGWPVLPLWGINEQTGRCMCGASDCKPGKHPYGLFVPHGAKDATTDVNTIKKWFANSNNINIGIVTGKASGLVILDVDPVHGGNESLKKFGEMPKTPTTKTGSGGTHYYFKHPDGNIKNSVGTIAAGLDVRGHNGYAVAPPSLHVSGQEYRWAIDPRAPLADTPIWLHNNSAKNRVIIESGDNGEKICEGKRNNSMTALAGKLRRNGLHFEAIYAALLYENGLRCNPPLPDTELNTIAESVSKYAPGKVPSEIVITPITKKLCDITPQVPQWLWPNRFPSGRLSLIVGDPDLGKSFLSLYISSRITTGRPWPDLPDENIEIGSVILLSAEDDLSDTIVPRLLKNDADVDLIKAIEGVNINEKQSFFSLARDLPALEDTIKQTKNVKLVIIDPLTAYCGSIDSHKNAEVRGLLAPVAQLASKYDVTVIGISHLRKGDGRAIYRTLGSLAFVAAARAVWLVTEDADDKNRRLLTPVKNNLATRKSSLAFRIVDSVVEFESTPLQITSDQALSPDSQDERSALDEAVEWLQQVLESGPMNKNANSELARKDGIAERTLRRATDKLGIVKKREGFGEFGIWRWQLPEGT